MISSEWFLDYESEHKVIGHRIKDHIVSAVTQFQRVKIFDTYYIGRVLVLDNKLQSAEADEYVYHECLVHPSMISAETREKVLILGGGEGATLREAVRYKDVKEIVMVDIDEELVKMSGKYLPQWHEGAFDDERVRLVFGDAFDFIEQTDETFDVIIMDISDPVEGTPSEQMYTQEFFKSVRKKIKPGGVFVTEATEVFYNPEPSDPHCVINTTLASVFPTVKSYCAYVPSFTSLWGFVIAYTKEHSSEIHVSDIDRTLAHHLSSELRYYDGEAHKRIFATPKSVQAAIDRENMVSTKNNPISVFSQ